jgi:protein gp37
MSNHSDIEWTVTTWNPVTGCSKVSPGCSNCYAEGFARRLQAQGNPRYQAGFDVAVHPDLLALPLRWRKPRLVFVNSMSDLFHEKVPADFIVEVFDAMREAGAHEFQILTKRSARVLDLDAELDWPPNVWLGVSVENADYLHRVDDLRATRAAVKFICFEPLLGSVAEADLKDIDWVIAGGESGPKARLVKKEWVCEVRDKCTARGVPFFFKQWGGTYRKKSGRELEGKTWEQMPRLPEGIPLFK